MKGGLGAFIPNDPAIGMLHGYKVYISPDRPKHMLYDEVIPGVPWPPAFKAEIDAWMLEFFGTYNLLRDDQALVSGSAMTIYVNPRMLARLKAHLE